jgi:hypothetical protein
MPDISKIITLTSLGSNAGPTFDAYYSLDCVNYTQSVDGNDISLPYIGSTATITIPDNTLCIKLVNLSSGCLFNDYVEYLGSATTLTPTTTLAPTTLTPTTLVPTTTLTPTVAPTTVGPTTTIAPVTTYWSASYCNNGLQVSIPLSATGSVSGGMVVSTNPTDPTLCATLGTQILSTPFISFGIKRVYADCYVCQGITTSTTLTPTVTPTVAPTTSTTTATPTATPTTLVPTTTLTPTTTLAPGYYRALSCDDGVTQIFSTLSVNPLFNSGDRILANGGLNYVVDGFQTNNPGGTLYTFTATAQFGCPATTITPTDTPTTLVPTTTSTTTATPTAVPTTTLAPGYYRALSCADNVTEIFSTLSVNPLFNSGDRILANGSLPYVVNGFQTNNPGGTLYTFTATAEFGCPATTLTPTATPTTLVPTTTSTTTATPTVTPTVTPTATPTVTPTATPTTTIVYVFYRLLDCSTGTSFDWTISYPEGTFNSGDRVVGDSKVYVIDGSSYSDPGGVKISVSATAEFGCPATTITPTATPTTLVPTTTSTTTATPTATPTTTTTATPTTTSALYTYNDGGRGNSEAGACSDASNMRTFYSNCNSGAFGNGCNVYLDAGGNNPLTGYTYVFMNGALWDINSSTGVIIVYSSNQC